MPSRSTSSKSKSGRRKYHSDPTNNRTRKNSYSTGLKMNAAFHKLSAEQKDYNVYMQTMTFLCHKVKIGTKEAILSPSQEQGLHKIASHLEQKFKEENMDFNVNAFKSLFRRTAHSLHQGGMLKSKLAGGNPKSDSSDSEDEAQMVVYQNIPVGARNQSAVYRWFSNAVSLRMNQEKLDILALLALFLGIFELLCAWASLSSLASTLTGSNAAEVTSGFSSFIVNEINSSGFFELFTFGFIGNGFNRIFSNQLDFLQSSLISQIGAVSTTLSDSIQNTCFSHLAEQGIWTKMADAFVPGNLDIQLQCIGEVTKIEGNRAVANISADFQLVMTRFRTDSQRVLNQAWSGVWYIRGAIGWFSYRLGYQGLAMSMFNMGETMKTYRPTRRIRVARPGEVEEIRSNSSLRRRAIVDNPPVVAIEYGNNAGNGGGSAQMVQSDNVRSLLQYKSNQPHNKAVTAEIANEPF